MLQEQGTISIVGTKTNYTNVIKAELEDEDEQYYYCNINNNNNYDGEEMQKNVEMLKDENSNVNVNKLFKTKKSSLFTIENLIKSDKPTHKPN